VQLLQTVNALQIATKALRGSGKTVALVPTMGALHDGHLALVKAAKRAADYVVVSIFVNPKQFGPNEDFDAYPRPADADITQLHAAGVDLLWMPSVAEMYPAGFATTISVAGLADRLCGVARPGHFDGVTTVVAKLFAQVRPDVAIFGEKDWQQLTIIRRMTADLDLGVTVVGMPTQREEDGLARSSRNAYLSATERRAATAFPTALKKAVTALENGAAVQETLIAAERDIIAGGFHTVDYVTLVDANSLAPLEKLTKPARLISAVRVGKTRLIDNFSVEPA
jgi:pantoate--beta-alanine ligase